MSDARSSKTESLEPDAGHLVWTDLEPRTGREQGRRRPVLVVSPVPLWRISRFLIVCPITSRVRPFGTSVVLPQGFPIQGEILTSHVRSIDAMNRPIRPTGLWVPQEVLEDVRAKLAALLGIHD